MRTFVAVDIDESILREIQHIRERLDQAGADVKWVKNDNTHLTVKFIGEISPDQAPDVCAALEKAAQDAEPFDLEIRGAGTFSRRRPSVLWVGCEDISGGLGRLHSAVESALQKLGIEKEDRKFSPHLTLGRVKSGKNIRKLLEALDAEQPAELGASRVESVSLFSSKLTPQGPIYSRLTETNLHGA